MHPFAIVGLSLFINPALAQTQLPPLTSVPTATEFADERLRSGRDEAQVRGSLRPLQIETPRVIVRQRPFACYFMERSLSAMRGRQDRAGALV